MYRGTFHLSGSLLGDLADEVQQATLLVQRNVMPCGDVLTCATHTSLRCHSVALGLLLYREMLSSNADLLLLLAVVHKLALVKSQAAAARHGSHRASAAVPFSCRKMRYSKLSGSPCTQRIAFQIFLLALTAV